MTMLYAFILTLIALGAAAYAQWRIPFHTANRRHALIARLILIVVGVAFGIAMATTYTHTQGWLSAVVFLAGFGVVHVPAAAILFLKRQRAKSQ
jgi:NADH:ubiquinone oxidoreductase subunit H